MIYPQSKTSNTSVTNCDVTARSSEEMPTTTTTLNSRERHVNTVKRFSVSRTTKKRCRRRRRNIVGRPRRHTIKLSMRAPASRRMFVTRPTVRNKITLYLGRMQIYCKRCMLGRRHRRRVSGEQRLTLAEQS